MLSKIKRWLIGIVTSGLFSKFIRAVYGRSIPHRGNRILIEDSSVSDTTVSHLFWHIYEKAEHRAVSMFLPRDLPVIELGSSLGILSSFIGSIKAQHTPLVCVEANPHLIDTIRKNLENNHIAHTHIVHGAIGPETSGKLWFKTAPSTLNGWIDFEETGIEVPAIDLKELLQAHSIDDFSLVCDIEGAEKYLLDNQTDALQQCRYAIVELHNFLRDGEWISRERLNEIFMEKTGMRLIDHYRHVYVYTR